MKKRIIIGLGVLAVIAVAAFLLRPRGGPAGQGSGSGPQPQAVLAVTATTATELAWPRTIDASGPLAPWQEAIISAEVGSLKITDVLVDVGSVVHKGQELVRLSQDSTRASLHKQEAELAQAKASLSKAKTEGERARRVKDSGALSEQQVAEYATTEETAAANVAAAEASLEATRIALDQTIVRAIDDGVITSRTATLGAVVNAGSELFRLVRQSRIEWNAELDARQLALVHPGQKAQMTLADGKQVQGSVRITAPALNANTLRGVVYVSLPADSGAKAGDYASGIIALDSSKALTVPVSSLVMRDGRAYLFVIGAEGKVASRLATTGRRRDDRIEILQGTRLGERLVESGGAFLSDGTQVRVIEQGPSR